MKLFKRTLLVFNMLLLYANSTFATTGAEPVEESSFVGKFVLLLITLGLVALVLFLGYKMDKNEAQEKRKERIIKKRDTDINDMYSEIYTSYNSANDIEEVASENVEPEEKEFEEVEDNEEIDEIVEEEEKTVAEETAVIETVYPKIESYYEDELEEFDDDVYDAALEDEIENYINEDIIDENEENDIQEEVEIEDNDTIQEELEDEEEEDDSEEEYYTDFVRNDETRKITFSETGVSVSDATMVFNTDNLKEENVLERISEIKGYDYEDNDIELLELEKTIADANIKKYTRRKKQTKKEEPKKKYTRTKTEKAKKEKTNKEEKAPAQRYTATRAKKEKVKEEIKEETKPKKWKKVDNKKETEGKPKRGRKPQVKKDTEEKPKRSSKSAK